MIENLQGRRVRRRPGFPAHQPTSVVPHATLSAFTYLSSPLGGRGYGATTVEAISEAADVPPATVYRLFSSKLGVLKSLLDVSIVGDHERVPMVERSEVQSLLAGPDAAERLRDSCESPPT